MSLAADLKHAMFSAMKAKNTIEKEILRVALGEITKTGDEATDQEVQAVLRKIIKSNREALSVTDDGAQKQQLEAEVAVLERFLPQALTTSQIQEALTSVADQIKAAPGQGPAMGIAMKVLKASGAEVESANVAQAVSALRG